MLAGFNADSAKFPLIFAPLGGGGGGGGRGRGQACATSWDSSFHVKTRPELDHRLKDL